VVLWELIYRKKPFDGLEALQVLYKVGVKYEILEIDQNKCDKSLVQLMLKCWKYDENERLDFNQIKRELIEIDKRLTKLKVNKNED
jgi:hypothetical protein